MTWLGAPTARWSCTRSILTASPPDFAPTLDGEPLQAGTDWHLMDGGTLELLGAACDTILAGGDHTVEASFTCPADADAPDAGDPTGGVD